jgi:hypothetical protein
MDINFHYFAVKVIALSAGFNQAEAEIIATFSQFVDDYKMNDKLPLRNVPAYAINLVDADGKFNTVQTGFSSLSTVIDSTQRNVVVPFHFIPFNDLPSQAGGEKSYVTQPASIGDLSLISNMLTEIIQQCRNNRNMENLLCLGLLTHIFADTYAHQMFNGFHADLNWVNVTAARDMEGKDLSSSYIACRALPTIGHAMAGHAPDETFLKYTIRRHNGQSYDIKNWEYFSGNCAMEILEFFMDALNLLPPTQQQRDVLKAELIVGFNSKSTKVKELSAHWRSINRYANVNFNYNAEDVLKSFLTLNVEKLPDNISEEDVYRLLLSPVEETDNENNTEMKLMREGVLDAVDRASDKFYRYNFMAWQVRNNVYQ